ncbi:MAG: transporter [Bacteroidaceae bacterium]|nr:transporter [Bacteroidaceae bacterium]
MISGVLMYLIYVNVPLFDGTHAVAAQIVAFVQPLLIFFMLFFTFCKVRLKELRVLKWHLWLLAFQMFVFIALSLVVAFVFPRNIEIRVLLETAMLCIVCPTATAAAVITVKLGGNASSLISYTMLINMSVAVVAPFFLTLTNPVEGVSFTSSFMLIMGKVFPLLLCPLAAAELLRYLFPRVHRYIVEHGQAWPFYLWLVSLALAIAVSARAIAHSSLPLYVMAGIAIVSLFCCMVQFALGRRIGCVYGHTVEGGQALGQKNTVFAIWLAYTFMTPVTAIAGGFYSIWHNVVNTWQLYRHNHNCLQEK